MRSLEFVLPVIEDFVTLRLDEKWSYDKDAKEGTYPSFLGVMNFEFITTTSPTAIVYLVLNAKDDSEALNLLTKPANWGNSKARINVYCSTAFKGTLTLDFRKIAEINRIDIGTKVDDVICYITAVGGYRK